MAQQKPQLDETSGKIDRFARGLLIGAVLTRAISPIMSIERAEVTQEWVISIGTIIVRHVLAQLVKEPLIALEPCSVVTTNSRGSAQKISKMKMMVVQILNRPETSWKSVRGLKGWVVLHELRCINVSPLSDQFLERL